MIDRISPTFELFITSMTNFWQGFRHNFLQQTRKQQKSWLSQTEIQEFIFFSQRTFHSVFYVQRTYYNDFARIHKQGLYPCRKDLDGKKERCWMPFLGNKAQSKSLCCSLMVVLSMSRSISRCTIFFLTRGSKASCSLWESTYGLRRLSLEERKMLLLLLLLLMAPLYFVCVPHWNGFLMILISTFCETLLRLNIAFEAFYTPKTKFRFVFVCVFVFEEQCATLDCT